MKSEILPGYGFSYGTKGDQGIPMTKFKDISRVFSRFSRMSKLRKRPQFNGQTLGLVTLCLPKGKSEKNVVTCHTLI